MATPSLRVIAGGADRRASRGLRGQCQIGIDFRSYGQRAIVTNVDCGLPHHGAAHQWFTSDQGIVALFAAGRAAGVSSMVGAGSAGAKRCCANRWDNWRSG